MLPVCAIGSQTSCSMKLEAVVNALRDRIGALDLAPVAVEAADRRQEISLPQIEGKQANAAADIDERLV